MTAEPYCGLAYYSLRHISSSIQNQLVTTMFMWMCVVFRPR